MRRRTITLTLTASAVTAALVAPQLASSAPGESDARERREEVRAEQAAVASQLDTSKASMAEIDAAISALEADLQTQQAALDKAEADLKASEKDVADAKESITTLTNLITALREEMSDRAIQAYVNPTGEQLLTALDNKDFTSSVEESFYAELRTQDDADLQDRLEGAEVDLQDARQKAEDAAARAEKNRAEQKRRTDKVAEAKARQQTLADDLQTTIDSQTARSIELAKTDRALSAQIAKEQAELQARLVAAQKAAEEQKARDAAAAKAAADKAEADRVAAEQARAYASVTAGGQESAPAAPSAPPPGASATPGPTEGAVSIAYVQGVPVNAQVADQVVAMINAAAADGVSLRIGNSYRSVARQIELRRQNCGSSYYAIYQMSSGSCRPPTARPGQSQHQLGLAIDFANCSTRGTACYQWLAGNASRFGYYNLPSEAWHWSTTGS